MDSSTKSKVEMFGVWCGIGYLVLLFAGWGAMAGFLPPTPPSAGADHIAALYHGDFTRIRIGMVITMFAALAFIPFAAVVARHIARIEEGPGVLTYTFMLGAAGNMALTFYPAVWWLTAAFRPDRDAALIHLMNDMAWLQFLGGISMYLAMPLAIMVASLCDKSPHPAFPRWSGYANGWMALTLLPDQLLFFFKKGIFAWNGLFGIWVPVVVFSGFFIVNVVVLRRRILRDRGQLPDSADASATRSLSGRNR
ncbi:hypothetical protein [Mycobacterium palustre]|uniref:DUF4386 domain-containing protein n=1 Tax=Mycobacterium palustre TaxID=153971 RepID=A0A1X1ZJ22_9MYCO|nr:hypothetical protein [Mycobacterium palustre]MCV7102822.1 hypothetical protein [Mycobacterium palustre]ORW23312.1 hypothetical protein AWC19_12200 [Mycobacterium palustre]